MKLVDEIEAEWTAEVERLEDEVKRLRAALEQVTRECDALNKGPVAVAIARKALYPE